MEFLLPLPKIYLSARPKKQIDNLLLHLWYPIELIAFISFIITKQFTLIDSLTMSLIMALGINVAHELIHKPQYIHKWFGRRLLEFSSYGFWEWQHLFYHHKNVGLHEDPATAPLGMSIYEFVPRSIYGTIVQAWKHDPQKFMLSLCNTLMIQIFLYYVFDFQVLKFYCQSAFFSIIFLEMINYLEHYGLLRKPTEKVTEIHSWDAPYSWSSLFLFKLPFHADHHINSYKSYTELKIRESSPKYIISYPVLLLVSLIPPLFFYISKIKY
jgi:alkane 1-monooxygenase